MHLNLRKEAVCLSAGEHTAALLQQLYDEYRLKLTHFCLARLSGEKEAAADCVQEAFLVLNSKLLSGEKIENPRAFLYRTAEIFVKRRQEQISKEVRCLVPLEKAEGAVTIDEIYNDIDYDLLAEKLIATLDEDEKQLYNLRYIQKTRVDDIALRLNISRPAASMRLIRLKARITDMVKELDFEKGG